MPDLSQLSDEQLEAYRDLLAQKQGKPAAPQLPGPAKPPLPEGLGANGIGNETNIGGGGNEPGIPAIVHQGIAQLGRALPSFSNSAKRGFSDLIEGGAKTLSPLAIPAFASAPVPSAIGAGLGIAAQKGGEKAASALGGDEDTQRLTGDITGLAGGPLLTKGLSLAARAPAPMLAKSALGISGRTEAYGATPGKAILEETRGFRPETIADSARGRIKGLNTDLESKAAASNTPVSLAPARGVLASAAAKASAANSEATPRELSPMQRQLTEPAPGFKGATQYPAGAQTPISIPTGMAGQPLPLVRGPAPAKVVAESQSPVDFLGMKRQFDTDFIRNWSPAANTKGSLGVARKTYGAMADEFDRAVPGAAELNQRISSLIPVAERARLTSMNAGVGERMLGRAGRPTGGLFPLLFGYHEGGLPGALAAIGGTEGISSPEVKMLLARGLHSGGKGLGKQGVASSAIIPLARR